MTEGEEEVHGLDRDGAKEPLGSLQARIHFAVASSAHLLPMELSTLTSNRTVTLPEHCTRQKKFFYQLKVPSQDRILVTFRSLRVENFPPFCVRIVGCVRFKVPSLEKCDHRTNLAKGAESSSARNANVFRRHHTHSLINIESLTKM